MFFPVPYTKDSPPSHCFMLMQETRNITSKIKWENWVKCIFYISNDSKKVVRTKLAWLSPKFALCLVCPISKSLTKSACAEFYMFSILLYSRYWCGSCCSCEKGKRKSNPSLPLSQELDNVNSVRFLNVISLLLEFCLHLKIILIS